MSSRRTVLVDQETVGVLDQGRIVEVAHIVLDEKGETTDEYRQAGIRPSMGLVGDAYDNAVSESCSETEARMAVFDFAADNRRATVVWV